MPSSRTLATSTLCILVCCSSARATITVEYCLCAAGASDSIGTRTTVLSNPRSIPTDPDPLHLDAFDGGAYSKNVFDWSVMGRQTVLSFDSELNRVGNRGANADLALGGLQFTANETTPYDISGFLNVIDVADGKSGEVLFYTSLVDLDLHVGLFRVELISKNTHDEQFTLGEIGGDMENALTGSLSGMLIAGHSYQFDLAATIRTDSEYSPGDEDDGASAIGNVTLKIGIVPEPSAFSLCCILGFMGLYRCRQIV